MTNQWKNSQFSLFMTSFNFQTSEGGLPLFTALHLLETALTDQDYII